jgi:tRNA-uridine 2-sulfurtransferase
MVLGYREPVIEVVGDSSRGTDWRLVRLTVDRDRIVSADADGLDRQLEGLTLIEAAAVGGDELAVDALANALGPLFRARRDPDRIAVAMSGGVDSAVALLRAGPNAIGVTLRLWIDPEAPDVDRACCSPEAVLAARRTCHARGIPHVTLDARGEFLRAIVEPFVRGYGRGETPNPCISCNGFFRFGRLLAFAKQAGAARLTTGHYARIVRHRGRLLLARGVDAAKDQSYMLARLDPRILDRICFPLGDQTKEETRAEAAGAGLAAAGRTESQEACFLGGGDYRRFLERRGLETAPGEIVDEQGQVVGSHEGFWGFTPGQRKGLGVATGRPLYAVKTVAKRNQVVVGPRESLARRSVRAEGKLHVDIDRADVKLRYRSPAVAGAVEAVPRGFRVRLDEPAFGVAPGQAAVLYRGDVVVGAGRVTSARIG